MKKVFLILIFVSLISTSCNYFKTNDKDIIPLIDATAPTSSQTNTAPTTSPATTTSTQTAENVDYISKYTTSLPEPPTDSSIYYPAMVGFVDAEKATALVFRGEVFALVNMNTGEILKQKEIEYGMLIYGPAHFGAWGPYGEITFFKDKFALPVQYLPEDTVELDNNYSVYDYDFNLIETLPLAGLLDEDFNTYFAYNPQTEKRGIFKVDKQSNITEIYPISEETKYVAYSVNNDKLFLSIAEKQTSEERIAVALDTDGKNVKEIEKSGIELSEPPYVRGNYALWTDEQVKGGFENCGLATGELLLFNIEKNEFEILETQYTNETNFAVLSQDGKYVVTALTGRWFSGGELPEGTNIINVYNAETKELVKTFNTVRGIRDLLVSNNRVYAQIDYDFYVYEI